MNAVAGRRFIWPEVLPTGDAVLYTAWRGSLDDAVVAVYVESTGESRRLVEQGTHPLLLQELTERTPNP